MLKKISRLYDFEGYARTNNLTVKEWFELADEYVRPILEMIKAWLDAEIMRVSPKMNIGDAITYILNQWSPLVNYLQDVRLEIDNNLIENAVRPWDGLTRINDHPMRDNDQLLPHNWKAQI